MLYHKFLNNLMICGKLNDNKSIVDFILNSSAPVYTACKLSWLYTSYAAQEKDKTADFQELGNFCEGIAYDMLHISTSYNTAAVLNAVDPHRIALLDILIDSELKKCVAHPNVQNYMGELWEGKDSRIEGWYSLWFFLACVFFPPIWVYYCFQDTSNAPTIKFICLIVSHVYFIALFILVIVVPWDRSYQQIMPTPYEWLLLLWFAGTLAGQLTEPQSRGGLGWLPVGMLLFAISGTIIHIVAIFVDGRDRENMIYGRDQVWAFAMLLTIMQTLDFLSLHHLFGPWSTIIRSLVQDLLRFLVILTLFIFAFTLHLTVVYKPIYGLTETDFPTSMKPLSVKADMFEIFEGLFFALFGLTSLEKTYDPETNPAITRTLSKAVFGLYEIITIVVLVNLLIAMMSNTYTRLDEQSDMEWKYGRAKLIRSLTKSPSIAVPNNLIVALVRVIKVFGISGCCFCGINIPKVVEDMENKIYDQDNVLEYGENAIQMEMGQAHGPSRLDKVVNWDDVVKRYVATKGWSIDAVEDLAAMANKEEKERAAGNQKQMEEEVKIE